MIRIKNTFSHINSIVDSIIYSDVIHPFLKEKLVPDGSINLIIDLTNTPQYIYHTNNKKIKYERSWISGMQLNPISISSNSSGLLIIKFKPSGSYPILQIPANELKNQVIDAELLLGESVKTLREKLQEAINIDQKFNIAEQWLQKRLVHEYHFEAAVDYVIKQTLLNPSLLLVESLIEKTGYSHRHFNRHFEKYVGLSPKQFQRTVRFNKVLSSIEHFKTIDWFSVAVDCGFYDQAHLIKEFKSFTGFSPTEYVSKRGDHINYIPIN